MDLIQSSVLTDTLVEEKQDDEEGSIPERHDYLTTLLSLTQHAVRQANGIPMGKAYSIKTSNPQNSRGAGETSVAVMSELFQILSFICPEELAKGPITVASADGLLRNYEKLVDCMELLLGKVDKGLNICNTKHPTSSMSSALSIEKDSRTEKSAISIKPTEYANRQSATSQPVLVTAPTSYWKYSKVDAGRFVPTLTTKPHAVSPLDDVFREAQRQVATIQNKKTSTTIVSLPSLPHPYEEEIRLLNWKDKSTPEGRLDMFRSREPKIYCPMESTPLVWVRTESELDEMVREIRDSRCGEIAMDVEHHSHHSYHGITCLIQLSTRNKDFVIDPVDIQEALVKLNEVTANPGIVKVLHGADSDVIWLQRDFSIYIVNLFDTGRAARLMELPGGASLANLMMFYCKVSADKRFQLSDWRHRPLSHEMVEYARSDTHYLLYIYDKIRNDILTKSGSEEQSNSEVGKQQMLEVLERSRQISLKLHTETPTDFKRLATSLIGKYRIALAPTPFCILVSHTIVESFFNHCRDQVELLEWRDEIAKSRDESPNAISNVVLLMRIANKMPQTWTDLQSLTNPVPRVIHEKAIEILEIVKRISLAPPSTEYERKQEESPKRFVNAEAMGNSQDKEKEEEEEEELREEDEQLKEQDEDRDEDRDEDETQNNRICSSAPRVLVSVSSAVRRKDLHDSNCIRRSNSLPADAFEVLLADPFPTELKDSNNPLNKSLPNSLNNHASGRLLARAISSAISTDFHRASSALISNLSNRKHPRAEESPQHRAAETKTPISPPEDEIRFATSCEVLIDKAGVKRRKQKLLMSHPDLEQGEVQLTERPAKRRKTSRTADALEMKGDKADRRTEVLSASLTEAPGRQWLKRNKNDSQSSPDEKKITEAVYDRAKDVLPAAFMTAQKGTTQHGLSAIAVQTKFYGSSSVKPMKEKTAVPNKKKRKK